MRQRQHVIGGGGYFRVGEAGVSAFGGHFEITVFRMFFEHCDPQRRPIGPGFAIAGFWSTVQSFFVTGGADFLVRRWSGEPLLSRLVDGRRATGG